MSVRDTFVQLGLAMVAVGASFATWALLTGPLAKYTKLGPSKPARKRAAKRDPGAPPRT